MKSRKHLLLILSILLSSGLTLVAQNMEVEGSLKITDGTEGAGKILTSDANGVASWQTAPTSTNSYAVGDFALGGIVFWVDESGQHGLVCAKTNQSSAIRWYAGTFVDTRAYGNHTYSGQLNTDIIIGSQGNFGDDNSPYAAKMCKDLITDGYSDWYLPSREELEMIYAQKAIIDATAQANGGTLLDSDSYWSSTEDGTYSAWIVDFNTGLKESKVKGFTTSAIRAIRAF